MKTALWEVIIMLMLSPVLGVLPESGPNLSIVLPPPIEGSGSGIVEIPAEDVKSRNKINFETKVLLEVANCVSLHSWLRDNYVEPGSESEPEVVFRRRLPVDLTEPEIVKIMDLYCDGQTPNELERTKICVEFMNADSCSTSTPKHFEISKYCGILSIVGSGSEIGPVGSGSEIGPVGSGSEIGPVGSGSDEEDENKSDNDKLQTKFEVVVNFRGPRRARQKISDEFDSSDAEDENGCSNFFKQEEALKSKCFKFKGMSQVRPRSNNDKVVDEDDESENVEITEAKSDSDRTPTRSRVTLETDTEPTPEVEESIKSSIMVTLEIKDPEKVQVSVQKIITPGGRRRLSTTTYRVNVDIDAGCGDDMVSGPSGIYCYPQYVSSFRRYVEDLGAKAHSSHEYGSYLILNTDAKSWTSYRPSQKSARNGVDYIFDLQFGYRKNGKKCPEGYMGSTCTERVCAYGLSSSTSGFLQQADGVHTPGNTGGKSGGTHSYTECSSQGVCDRITGRCSCFAGYQGKGCRRTTCPNDCSGHGRCLTNHDINSQYVGTASGYESSASFGTQFWDYDKTMQCACDRGYSGHDCSSRICPHGDDVLTSCADESVHDDQTIVLTNVRTAQSNSKGVTSGPCVSQDSTAGSTNAPFFFLTFTDHLGGIYTTKPIQAQVSHYVGGDKLYTDANQMPTHAAATAAAVQVALEALPNHVIPSVQVRGTTETLSGVPAIPDDDGLPQVAVLNPESKSTVDIPQWSRVFNNPTSRRLSGDAGFADCIYKHLKLTVRFVDEANAGKQNTLQCSLPSAETNCESGMQPAMPLSSQQIDAESGTDVQIECLVEDVGTGPNGDLPRGGTHEENAECGNRGLCDTSTGKCNCFPGHTGEACGIQSNYV